MDSAAARMYLGHALSASGGEKLSCREISMFIPTALGSSHRHGAITGKVRCWLGSSLLLGPLTLTAACSSSPGGADTQSADDPTGLGGQSTVSSTGGSPSAMGGVTIDLGAGGTSASACGDGILTSDEACDDANLLDGDGCSADCLGVESGFSCPLAGLPCQRVARCGDGVVVPPEICDDGNLAALDGCATNCQLESGFKCTGSPSVCTPTTCGDGLTEGTEGCDDGNHVPFDGCGTRCQSEPDCTQGACRSRCGDGLTLGEACDDGNNLDGDGCAADCTIEPGFECAEQLADCDTVGGACVVRTDVIYRDFAGEAANEHPDFLGCEVLPVTLGLVEPHLDGEGKPVLAAESSTTACVSSKASFAEWYRTTGSSVEVPGTLDLFDNGSGAFVNRYGTNGEPWIDAEGNAYDGSPLFFPLDGLGRQAPGFPSPDEPAEACLNRKYGERPENFVGGTHNFHFTSEVMHWFKYDTSTNARLDFTGDDDVWVFINGTLAVDLGGVHHPADGSVTLDATTGPLYGLVPGGVYAIKVFQAERRICGSTFRLTLSGFSTGRSQCRPLCGDGIVSLGEECDDGINDGGYNECGPDCRRGEFCGDGVLQSLFEDCDDGNNIDGDGCGSACRRLVPPR